MCVCVECVCVECVCVVVCLFFSRLRSGEEKKIEKRNRRSEKKIEK